MGESRPRQNRATPVAGLSVIRGGGTMAGVSGSAGGRRQGGPRQIRRLARVTALALLLPIGGTAQAGSAAQTDPPEPITHVDLLSAPAAPSPGLAEQRDAMAAFLFRMSGAEAPAGDQAPFTDMPAGAAFLHRSYGIA